VIEGAMLPSNMLDLSRYLLQRLIPPPSHDNLKDINSPSGANKKDFG
jgi:hypothetical protein